MKSILIIVAICFALSAPAQTWGDLVGYAGINAVSGAFRGRAEAGLFHPANVQKIHHNYKPPSETWRNKYKNGDPAQGPAFLGSTNIFVAFTDPYHRDRLFEHQFKNGSAMWLSYATERPKRHKNWYETFGRNYSRKPWWAYGCEWIVAGAADGVGFTLTYDYLYSGK